MDIYPFPPKPRVLTSPQKHQQEQEQTKKKKKMEAARTVKDDSPHEFVKSYAAHLKRSGRVSLST